MEIFNHRQKLLDALEINAKKNDNFAIEVISTESVDGSSCYLIGEKDQGKSD